MFCLLAYLLGALDGKTNSEGETEKQNHPVKCKRGRWEILDDI